jgi:hypothetical protein
VELYQQYSELIDYLIEEFDALNLRNNRMRINYGN